MAAAICRHHLATAGLPGVASSAGLLPGGTSAPPAAVAALARLGIDLSHHRSATLEAGHVAGADLVLGMERIHLRAAAVTVPGAFTRCFTILDFLRRGLDVGSRPSHESVSQWLDRLGTDRRPDGYLADDPTDAVADPQGAGPAAYQATAGQLDTLVRGVLFLL